MLLSSRDLSLRGLALAFVRLARGSSQRDRVVALDLVATTVVRFTAYYAITTGHALLPDVAVGVALVGFPGTIAFARHVGRRGRAAGDRAAEGLCEQENV